MFKFLAIPATALALLVGSSAIAEASPYTTAEIAICDLLDMNPTDQGVMAVVAAGARGVAKGNYPDSETFAEVVMDAVTNRCPDYYLLVMRSAFRHSSEGRVLA